MTERPPDNLKSTIDQHKQTVSTQTNVAGDMHVHIHSRNLYLWIGVIIVLLLIGGSIYWLKLANQSGLHNPFVTPDTGAGTAIPKEEATIKPIEEPTALPVEEPTTTPIEEPTALPVEEPTTTPIEELTPIQR